MKPLLFFLISIAQINGIFSFKILDILKTIFDEEEDLPTSTSMPANYPTLKTTDSPTSFLPAANSPTPMPSKETIAFPTSSPTKIVTELPTSNPTEKPTSIPTNYPTLPPTLNPTSLPTLSPTVKPTNSPTVEGEPTDKPTFSPTLKPTNLPTLTPTNNPTDSSSPSIETFKCSRVVEQYQLKLFWEKGMEWQQSRSEKAWCAECEDDCDEREFVHIRECDDRDEKQLWIFYDCSVRPKRNTNLCLTAGADTYRENLVGKVNLRPCTADNIQQIFRLNDPNDPYEKFKFKILQPGYEDICLTQEHHPRDKEKLRFWDCKEALENDRGVYDDTSHWVVGAFDGHR